MTRRKCVNTAVRIPPAVHERLRVAAAERDVSVNWMITRAIQEFLPRLLPVEELRLTRDQHPPVEGVNDGLRIQEHMEPLHPRPEGQHDG